MNTIKFKTGLLVWILISLFAVQVSSQTKDEKKAQNIKSLVESKQYVFTAETAIPMSGSTVHLTSNYEVYVNKDSLVSFLPYYGRAYSAPYNSTKSPLDFSSTDFKYTVKSGKKGSYIISIEFKDLTDVRDLYLTISSSGYGSLSVNSNNRQTISFYGHISPKEDKK